MLTKVQNWRTTEVLKLRDWFCWTFLALILLDLFSLEHTNVESFVTSFDLCLWICMQLVPTYLPTFLPIGNFIEHFTIQQLGLPIWTSDRVTSSLEQSSCTYFLTHPSIQQRQIANDLTEWIWRMNNAMSGVAECSWVRVHPIPLNQFTLFPHHSNLYGFHNTLWVRESDVCFYFNLI